MYNYLKNGKDIYRLSFSKIRNEANLACIPSDIEEVVIRMIHSCGMTDIVKDIRFSKKAGQIGRTSLLSGSSILCDTNMVLHGIIKKKLPAKNKIYCTINEPSVSLIAKKIGNTYSAAAIELWKPYIKNSIVVIGNAPTSLFHLLEIINNGAPYPALILGFPVGFVGAEESKNILHNNSQNIPYITLLGRRGGSAIAAAAINALFMENE